MESKRKLPLAVWIFVGLLVGIAAGMALMNISVGGIEGKDFAKAYIKPWGDIFLNLLKFVVVPIVLFSIAAGVISMKDIKCISVWPQPHGPLRAQRSPRNLRSLPRR